MIRKTKTGKLYNISFKLDDQTRAGEYGTDFHSEIKLEQFVNLNTGNLFNDKAHFFIDGGCCGGTKYFNQIMQIAYMKK